MNYEYERNVTVDNIPFIIKKDRVHSFWTIHSEDGKAFDGRYTSERAVLEGCHEIVMNMKPKSKVKKDQD